MKNPYLLFFILQTGSGLVFAKEKPVQTENQYQLNCRDTQTKNSFEREVTLKVDLRNECPPLVDITSGADPSSENGKSFFVHLTGWDRKPYYGACMYTNIAPITYLVEVSLVSKGQRPANGWTGASSAPGQLNCTLFVPDRGD